MIPAIRFNHLAKTYGKGRSAKEALRGVSFDVDQGEIFGFLGPNGAGKTTAIHVLLNFLFPTSGSTEIMGVDSHSPLSRRQVGFLPEIFNFDSFLSGKSFLELFGKLSSRQQEEVAAHIPELLSFLDMPDAASVRIKNYSKGMTQKIGLAQALIGDPQILILDEPTSGMDPIAKAKIKQLFLKLRGQGKTIFLSSHILSDIEDIADRVATINQGVLLAVDKIRELNVGREGGSKIVYTNGDDALLSLLTEQAKVTRQENRVEVVCGDRETKNFALQSILQHGGDVISVKAIGSSLESYFLRLMKQEELSDDYDPGTA